MRISKGAIRSYRRHRHWCAIGINSLWHLETKAYWGSFMQSVQITPIWTQKIWAHKKKTWSNLQVLIAEAGFEPATTELSNLPPPYCWYSQSHSSTGSCSTACLNTGSTFMYTLLVRFGDECSSSLCVTAVDMPRWAKEEANVLRRSWNFRSLASWLVYIGYFHFRYMFDKKHPRINSIWIIFGIAVILTTLLWVNLSKLFLGLHSYAT